MEENIGFIPTTKKEVKKRGWEEIDVVIVTGDAYVDHPSFPASLLGRVLIDAGFRVGIISRPDPEKPEQLKTFGLPRLFFGVTSGSLDSMVANYTALKKRRSDDPYAPEGKGGGRPDRALTAYCNLVRQAYGKATFIVAGGIEGSLRRFAHYDYWSDSVRRPILMDCGADILVHGMGEGPIVEIAKRLRTLVETNPEVQKAYIEKTKSDPAIKVDTLSDVKGIVYRLAKSSLPPDDGLGLPSSEEVADDPKGQIKAFSLQEGNRDKLIWQESGGMRVISNPPWPPLSSDELDKIYELPFSRNVHPMYGDKRIPALEQARFSVTSHRGCFGGCSFCAIGVHQGKTVSSRSPESVIREIESIVAHPDFKGTINDVGGPSANMYSMGCKKDKRCERPSCVWPNICKNLEKDQQPYLDLIRRASQVPGVKHLFITTGIRTDLANLSSKFIEEVARKHTSGLLKVAPEQVVPEVLCLMRKPKIRAFEQFMSMYRRFSKEAERKQFILPYFMAAHPGSNQYEMKCVNSFLKANELKVEQCQIFTPTPGTASTVMYATGINPATGKKVFVEKDSLRKQKQKDLILYHLQKDEEEGSHQKFRRTGLEDKRERRDQVRGGPDYKKSKKRRHRIIVKPD